MPQSPLLQHQIVFYQAGQFAGWPANNGLWRWNKGGEALVSFVTGQYKELPGHNILPPYAHRFARTRDGGATWRVETPTFPVENAPARELPAPLDFRDENLILRLIGTGYEGSNDGRGAFAVSRDRGRTWEGPFRLGDLADKAPLIGWELTTRTDYIALSRDQCCLMLSARPKIAGTMDRTFWAMMDDGGRKIRFGGWIVPPKDPHRAVMPSSLTLTSTEWMTAIRRRKTNAEVCWVDCYFSADKGQNWELRSKIADTGIANGNPPALILLQDKRLLCAYGDRKERKMFARVSADSGKTWQEPLVLRDDYQADSFGDSDFGYPRAFQRPDGKIVVLYYWANAIGKRKSHRRNNDSALINAR